MDALIKTQAFINGGWHTAKTGKSFAVSNPADGKKITDMTDCDASDTTAAIDAAYAALFTWKSALPTVRAAALRAWQKKIEENAETLARLLTHEQGKPITEARGEIAGGAAMLGWAAEEARRAYGETIPAFKTGTRVITTREAIGVVAAITPWNFPHSMITRKVAPALAAGCTVVLKPAEDTPLSALALAALAHEAGIPKGVFNVVPTSNPKAVARALTDDARVRKLSFTGSTEVGRLLMAQCAPNLKRLSLELGGNAPFIVFDDADLSAAVEGAMASKFRNAGQTCVCANRLYIQRGIYGRFIEALNNAVAGLKLGAGDQKGVTTGPLINHDGLQKVEDLVADALAKGASLTCGGRKSALGGTYYEPTIIRDATPAMRLASEEIFGPVAAIFPFDTEEDALKLANATEHGLAAYVYTRDLGRAFRMSTGLEYGMVGVNEALLASEAVPFGGIKQSGFGREGGPHSLDDYMAIKYTLFGGL